MNAVKSTISQHEYASAKLGPPACLHAAVLVKIVCSLVAQCASIYSSQVMAIQYLVIPQDEAGGASFYRSF